MLVLALHKKYTARPNDNRFPMIGDFLILDTKKGDLVESMYDKTYAIRYPYKDKEGVNREVFAYDLKNSQFWIDTERWDEYVRSGEHEYFIRVNAHKYGDIVKEIFSFIRIFSRDEIINKIFE